MLLLSSAPGGLSVGARREMEQTLGGNMMFVRLLLSSQHICEMYATKQWINTLLQIAGQTNSKGLLKSC